MEKPKMFLGANSVTFERAKELRQQMTHAEKILWEELRQNKMGFKVRAQHPIRNYIADFYCHSALLVIEIDGKVHESDDSRAWDDGRSHELEKFGILVIRFTNDEIENNLSEVLNSIKSIIDKRVSKFTNL